MDFTWLHDHLEAVPDWFYHYLIVNVVVSLAGALFSTVMWYHSQRAAFGNVKSQRVVAVMQELRMVGKVVAIALLPACALLYGMLKLGFMLMDRFGQPPTWAMLGLIGLMAFSAEPLTNKFFKPSTATAK